MVNGVHKPTITITGHHPVGFNWTNNIQWGCDGILTMIYIYIYSNQLDVIRVFPRIDMNWHPSGCFKRPGWSLHSIHEVSQHQQTLMDGSDKPKKGTHETIWVCVCVRHDHDCTKAYASRIVFCKSGGFAPPYESQGFAYAIQSYNTTLLKVYSGKVLTTLELQLEHTCFGPLEIVIFQRPNDPTTRCESPEVPLSSIQVPPESLDFQMLPAVPGC